MGLIRIVATPFIREPFLKIPTRGIQCLYGRGIGVTEWPIIEERLEDMGGGITLHLIERGVDTGPIVMKRKILVLNGDTISMVESKFWAEMVNFMIKGVRMARDGNLDLTSQTMNTGRQYFVLHKRVRIIAGNKLAEEHGKGHFYT